MSRKLERQIERNRKLAKRYESKGSKRSHTAGAKAGNDKKYKGRSILFPIMLILLSLFLMIVLSAFGERDKMFWFAISCYWILALLFFLKRPYLTVNNTDLAFAKFSKEYKLKPAEIEQISIDNKTIIITPKNKSKRWVFTRAINLYPIDEMGDALAKFAAKHAIAVKDERDKRG